MLKVGVDPRRPPLSPQNSATFQQMQHSLSITSQTSKISSRSIRSPHPTMKSMNLRAWLNPWCALMLFLSFWQAWRRQTKVTAEKAKSSIWALEKVKSASCLASKVSPKSTGKRALWPRNRCSSKKATKTSRRSLLADREYHKHTDGPFNLSRVPKL